MNRSAPLHFCKRIALALLPVVCGAASLFGAPVSVESDAWYSFVGGSRMQNGTRGSCTISEEEALLRCVVSTQAGDASLVRTGFEWQRYTFSASPAWMMLPDTLESVSMVLGVDTTLGAWLFRVEAQPGFYGDFDNPTLRCFNMPFILGATYLAGADLQWIAGISINVQRDLPALPAAGVRWKFADHWVVNAILPKPRFEYLLNKSSTLYLGGDFKVGTYRVSGYYGDEHNNPALNNSFCDYTEIRTGGGAEIKIASALKLDFETGCMVYRQFNFGRPNVLSGNDSGGAYGMLSVNYSF